MEIIENDPSARWQLGWLERADQVGQVNGSSPHGPTIHLTDSTQREPMPHRSIGVTRHHLSPPLTSGTRVIANTYTYDPVGNRLSSLSVSPYVNNTSNELASTSNASYAYDYNGNTTSKTDSTGMTNYTWDYENRLASATLPGTGGSISFKYDPLGRRVQKAFTQNSTTTTINYLYDGSNAIADIDQNGSVLARYSETQNIDEPLAELRSGTISYYEADGLGSVTSLTSGAGAIANTYTYDSFGNLTASTGSITNRFQYTAREFDSESGLYYYRARYYDPMGGRFLSEDPDGFSASPNFYAYVDNDPGDWADPMGLDKVQVCCRPLRKAKPFLMIWHHCYIKISDFDGTHTWGILPNKQGSQVPSKDDSRNSGGKCKDVPGTLCKIDKLRQGLDDDVDSGSCPSCGPNYRNWWWRFAGYNSNTFVYNMLSGAGFAPPSEPRSPGYNPAPGGWYH
ncbi:MAG: RHS repeat-associated core domain-containing protein [Candidatus Acidiferrales bacterium]